MPPSPPPLPKPPPPPGAAAPAAVSPTATATDALPPVILEGRFEGYMSPSYVAAHKREYYKFYWDNAREDFTFWQDRAFDELQEHSGHASAKDAG